MDVLVLRTSPEEAKCTADAELAAGDGGAVSDANWKHCFHITPRGWSESASGCRPARRRDRGIGGDAGDEVPHGPELREPGWADVQGQDRRALEPAHERGIRATQTREDGVLGGSDGLTLGGHALGRQLPFRPDAAGDSQLDEDAAAAPRDVGLDPGIDAHGCCGSHGARGSEDGGQERSAQDRPPYRRSSCQRPSARIAGSSLNENRAAGTPAALSCSIQCHGGATTVSPTSHVSSASPTRLVPRPSRTWKTRLTVERVARVRSPGRSQSASAPIVVSAGAPVSVT